MMITKRILPGLLVFLLGLFLITGCKQDKQKDGEEGDEPKTQEQTDSLTDSVDIAGLSEKIRENPRNPQLFEKRAELHAGEGNYKEAINDLEISLKLDSVSKSTYYSLIDYHMQLGQSGKAREVAEKCLEIHPRDKESMLRLAQIYYYVKDYNKALSYIKTIKEFNLQDADTYFIQGLIYREAGKPGLAISAFQRTIEFDEDYIAAYNVLGQLLAESKDPLAQEYYLAGLRRAPDNLELHYNLGFYYQQSQAIDSAMHHYNYIIDNIDFQHYGAHYNKGFIALVYQDDYQTAVDEFSQALSIDSTAHKAYYNRGYARELMGEFEKARQDYNKALSIRENYELAIQGLNSLDQKMQ
ncbi:MAG: tetratricopeptide repeat protein [Bacteroidota bacterium]